MNKLVYSTILAPLALAFSTGCNESIPLAEVEGVLLIDGKPGHKVKVEFVPEVGTEGPTSKGMTDDQGKFSLKTVESGGNSQPGVVVGTHRVVLYDIQLAESATGKGIPDRIDREYSSAGRTPLRQTVSEGPQTITIEIP